MALFRSLIRIYAEQHSRCQPGKDSAAEQQDPAVVAHVVRQTNDYIARNHGHEGMLATIFLGVLDTQTGNLEYVNAGHEPLFVAGREGIRTPLNPTGPAVGLMSGTAYDHQTVNLAPGEVLMGYTDGLTEARSPEGEFYSRHRLRSMLTKPPYSAGEPIEKIKISLFNLIGSAPRDDDVTLIAVQRAAPQMQPLN
jgi:sigma-B regulation protein RsbU (phosphoserine phosphatase)